MTEAYKVYAFLNALIKRTGSIFSWIISVPSFTRNPKANCKRLFAIYDLTSQPCSIGDFLNFNFATIVQCHDIEFDYVDIAIINDIERLNASKELSSITEDNSLYYLASIIPVAQINRKIGSILIFNSHSQLEQYIAGSGKYYKVWPNALKYAGNDYLYYAAFNDIFFEYSKKYGHLPNILCRNFLIEWTNDFFINNVINKVPVTVNLRNNKLFSLSRNSNIECWIEFFVYCQKKYPVKFIVICASTEVDIRMRGLDNVIIAKDFYTGIEQDLALINTSAVHMGASSGPFSMAWYNEKPYLMFSWNADVSKNKCIIKEGDYYRFSFSHSYQRMFKEPETMPLMVKQFEEIWNAIDTSKYLSVIEETKENKGKNVSLNWLR
jgi:hypothetical protein